MKSASRARSPRLGLHEVATLIGVGDTIRTHGRQQTDRYSLAHRDSPEKSMIVRTWRGWTRPEDAGDYADYILGTGIFEYKARRS